MPDKPQLMLATTSSLYNLTDKPNAYFVSEKLDGVRAYWTGKKLISRSGKVIYTPNWFTANLPKFAIEGELWINREKFNQMSALVNQLEPNDEYWQHVNFMLFDLPKSELTFEMRLAKLQKLVDSLNLNFVKLIPHQRFEHFKELESYFQQITEQGGEGIMMNLATAHYKSGRHQGLLKIKPYYDDEAVVVDHVSGKGKFENMLGALVVKNSKGQIIKIGTGFSINERQNPPKFGKVITYKYFGYTNTGLPRFASFLRVRDEE